MLSLVSFAGMTLNKCAILRIGTLTGGPLCRENHPWAVVKEPYMIYTCRLSFCKTGVYNVRLLIILERECSSMYRKKEREYISYEVVFHCSCSYPESKSIFAGFSIIMIIQLANFDSGSLIKNAISLTLSRLYQKSTIKKNLPNIFFQLITCQICTHLLKGVCLNTVK